MAAAATEAEADAGVVVVDGVEEDARRAEVRAAGTFLLPNMPRRRAGIHAPAKRVDMTSVANSLGVSSPEERSNAALIAGVPRARASKALPRQAARKSRSSFPVSR